MADPHRSDNDATATPNAGNDPALEVDDNDSAYYDDDSASETTSVASSLLKGHFENGRRYASLRDDYWGPSDEAQYEIMDTVHAVYLLMRSHRENILFAAPIQNPKRILDLGTGPGTWAVDVADKYPDASVYGVDLFPPPTSWVPPNCFLEVEDISKEWTWKQKFDLIHMRFMVGSLTDDEWADLYRQAYEHLEPGGWIEQVEPDVNVCTDDGTLDPDGNIAQWGPLFIGCGKRAGRSVETVNSFRPALEKAGFVNAQEDYFKVPIGPWAKSERLKEAGRVNYHAWVGGLEGYGLFLLTRFGPPEPWSKEEVLVWVAKVREEFKKPGQHIYQYARRVWAQKPTGESTKTD